ncbi:vacuolar protein sorting 50 [Nomia melanderi]|uniref:vacuolar protein sorting 50 n=1 Tax=Nomia melanderi TaxID=2448451 RepID=UPI0013042918|nr:syndetin [Nomia melanderi]XP_031849319.1 syndetin [Nomia melanderi]XP_031849320.1 syndetin [Nomia melanderi]XP_031849321.1 syndetin [Nomia melanderi]XP_031849322.1 syndetin [Nomia melanderi]XP_031849323.1 syndetin [Nomia melanderi]
MEDLKFKFFGLINKQNVAKVPHMGLHSDFLNPSEPQKLEDIQFEANQSTQNEPIPNEEILESIEEIYFNMDHTFDSCKYELEKLPKVLQSKEIEESYKKLKQQHQVVSRKVLQLILEKQDACKKEFEEILLIQEQLQDVLEICRMGRSDLKLAEKQFTTASLGILANYQKRQIVKELLNNLNTIKTLQRTGDRLQELLNEKNYPRAISLLLECQSAAQTYKHFHCIAALNGKLQDILEQAEVALDVTLSKMCTQFNVETYTSVQEAYALLGKTQSAMDQLHMHFTAAVHNTAFAAVHSYVGGDTKKQYKQLCQLVPRENCITCLTELCKSLWTILSSYYLVVNWHNTQEGKVKFDTDSKDLEDTSSKEYVKHKLGTSMIRIWHDVEMKISIFLMNTDLTYIKFEQFVQVLGIVNRLIEIGEELCGFKSENLQESIRKQSLSYFSHYHASRLDELRMFLENDGWELCPVKSNFVATQLQEFKSLKPSLNICKVWNNSDNSNVSENDNLLGTEWVQKYLEEGVSPFSIGLDDTMDEDILINSEENPTAYFSDESDDDIPDELKHEYVDDSDYAKTNKKKYKQKQLGPMITNTTLSILRVSGKYLQMSRLLRSIAVTVIQSMIQFYELCFYTAHLFFTSDLLINSDSLYSPKLKLSLARIKENLIICENDTEDKIKLNSNKVRQPQLSSIVNLTQPEKLHGLTERIVAVESLIFLGQQYEALRPYLEHLIASSPQRGFLHQFYMQTIASTVDLRKPVYMAVASQALDIANILNLMNKVNWEVTDVMSQHSGYIDELLKEIYILNERLKNIGSCLPLSNDVCNAVWENVAHLITHTLVEGFSIVKKCSNGGRALMQLDFTQLKSQFEALTSLRPMPHREYVELYIKAYYLPENILEEWIKEHKEYSVKHLIGLICSACQNNKKTRQRLIALIEEQRPGR